MTDPPATDLPATGATVPEAPAPVFVLHGHFYQPPRENPWTDVVSMEPSAAPYPNWNARITAECYRPNGWARILDERGLVVGIVNNYAYLSFNVGPTLLSWLEQHEPSVYARILEGDREGGGAIAQAYNHVILPLANERDVRTQVRWGLADFAHRFGRPAEGMWLPETAVNEATLAVLAEEGVRFVTLAPHQAVRVRPLPDTAGATPAGRAASGSVGRWVEVPNGSIVVHRPYRWLHPTNPSLGLDIVFYDGPFSHEIAFATGTMTAEDLAARVRAASVEGGMLCAAADGETFGHHHRFTERSLAYALPVAIPRDGLRVGTLASVLREHRPVWQVEVQESSWSCVHGVGRWQSDCGCSTGGVEGANQAWRRPLRDALDLVRDHGIEVFERRGAKVLTDPWAARDAYIQVLLGASDRDRFVAEHVVDAGADEVKVREALTLLEHQRQAMLMYTSCGWFFWDLAGLETVQILRYAAKSMDLLVELGEDPQLEAFLDVLGEAQSNVEGEGNGRQVWEHHVMTARVDAQRALAVRRLAQNLGMNLDVGQAQELVYEALTSGEGSPELRSLGQELGLDIDHLGIPKP